MTIAEILLMLAEIAAARAVVDSAHNRERRTYATRSWNAALDTSIAAANRGDAGRVYREQVNALHEWRKAEIAKASAKVQASFGITPRKEPSCTHTANRAAMV